MKIKVLGSFGSEGPGQRPSAFLVDDKVLVDAGTVGGALSPAEQIEVEYALVSHAHFDHIAGLAFLTDTLAMIAPERRVTACSIAPVLDSLRTHVFNDVVWPMFSGDTGPTKQIWKLAREMRGIKAVIVETSFPNRMDALARTSGHLTPEMLKRELDKAPPDIPVWIYHVKPQLYQETAEELAKVDSTRIHIVEQGKTYTL